MSSLRTQSSAGAVVGFSSVSSDRTGAASTGGGSHSHSHSHRKHHHHHRSRSAPRTPEKPPRKRHLNTGTSLASIPSQIKLSMLNSGLISYGILKIFVVKLEAEARKKYCTIDPLKSGTEKGTSCS
ncbi:myotubularin-related protein DDB_G0290005-like [Chelonus insularis]|uniref:myotubularin-related protein DDB_G0290005-like n=1 Tax=Chelonus insularis TaxID=460826 RepID=UPI00158BD136|nr:myotubularin-related protein DDB_G0290005-like [Chelonus insularis]